MIGKVIKEDALYEDKRYKYNKFLNGWECRGYVGCPVLTDECLGLIGYIGDSYRDGYYTLETIDGREYTIPSWAIIETSGDYE
jgi:hypothetical protein